VVCKPRRDGGAPESPDAFTGRTDVTQVGNFERLPLDDLDLHEWKFTRRARVSMAFEILDGAFVSLSRRACAKGPEIAPLAGLAVELARVQAVFSGAQFADHADIAIRTGCLACRRPPVLAVGYL